MNNQPTIFDIVTTPEKYHYFDDKRVKLIDKNTNDTRGEITFRLKKFVYTGNPHYTDFLKSLKVEILSPENSPNYGGKKFRKSRKSRKSRKNKK